MASADSASVPLASLDLLRRLTDRHVLDQVLAAPLVTRAEIAASTGISKPTISESVRRLEQARLLVEVGPQPTARRGRSGVYYALRGDLGVALAVAASPDGLTAETYDLRGDLLRRVDRATPSPVTAAVLDPLLLDLVRDATAGLPPVRASALSVAGPVDRATGRLVHLPKAPFLVDELDPRSLFGPALGGRMIIDNDVNWAAAAEHHDGVAGDLDDFCYLHLGHGLGGAYVRSGEPIRGSGGLAGEPAYVITAGPGGRAMRLVDCFAELGLLRAGSDAIDVALVGRTLAGGKVADRRLRDAVVDAVAGVVASMATLLNPSGVVIGGPWSGAADFAGRLAERVAETAVIPVSVRLARLGEAGPLIGVRRVAIREAQNTLLEPLAADLV